jgi:hypothetical protein
MNELQGWLLIAIGFAYLTHSIWAEARYRAEQDVARLDRDDEPTIYDAVMARTRPQWN